VFPSAADWPDWGFGERRDLTKRTILVHAELKPLVIIFH